MAPSFLQRIFGPFGATPPPTSVSAVKVLDDSPKRLAAPTNEKQDSFSLLPQGAYGPNYAFFSPDGGRTFFDIHESATVMAFAAYWYVATRWRAQKIAEAPLIVVKENQQDGNEEWLPEHELVGVLDMPSLDYDMGELLEITSRYLDDTGAALWVLDKDRIGRIGRITPFKKGEFEVFRSAERLYAQFRVQTSEGQRWFGADEVCFFRDTHGAWHDGKSRLDVAMAHLRLGQRAMRTVHDLLSNSVWPSLVISPDKEWNPDPKTYEQYKRDIQNYGRVGSQGKPFVALGGAQVQDLQARIRDLVPEDILSRVESVVAAVSGVPAVVLQFQVGLENSPWSQMAQARRMAYDDVIVPSWGKFERILSRQLLRLVDEDPTHFLRFDRTNIDALKADEMLSAEIATVWGKQASLNERRQKMGLEPVSEEQDPEGKADEIPELTQPSPEELLAATRDAARDDDEEEEGTETGLPTDEQTKARALWFERKIRTARLVDAFRGESENVWQVTAAQQLKIDATEIAQIVETILLDASDGEKALQVKARGKERAMNAVADYLNGPGRAAWQRKTSVLALRGAERAGAAIAADINVSYVAMHADLVKFASRHSAKMIKGVNRTTKSLVSDIIQGGIDDKRSSRQIATLIRDATGFSLSRAKLIARTETTNIFNGAPVEALGAFKKATGRAFTKTWSGALDEKERDEHVAMEGETVPVDKPFSNGLMYPSEPGCRCTSLFDEVED